MNGPERILAELAAIAATPTRRPRVPGPPARGMIGPHERGCACARCIREAAEAMLEGFAEGIEQETAKRVPTNRAERRAVERAWRRRRR